MMEEDIKNLHLQFKNSYTQLLFKMYDEYTDFRLLVDKLVDQERITRGHCSAVQDAAKLADLISYNHIVRKNLQKSPVNSGSLPIEI